MARYDIDISGYKSAKIKRAAQIGDITLYTKEYITDGDKDYVIIDTDPDSDDESTIIVRRLYHSRNYGEEWFYYHGFAWYNWMFGRVL